MATVVFTIHYVQGSPGKNGNDGNTGLIVSIIDIVTTYMYMYIIKKFSTKIKRK